MSDKPTIGVSACLLGEKVRYDGNHRRCPLLTEQLSAFIDFLPECPEMGMGLGVPRPTIGLYQSSQGMLLKRHEDQVDLSQTMERYCQAALQKFASVDGFVFKKGSPSCGPWQVDIIQENGDILKQGMGQFAYRLSRTYPWIPLAEEQSLQTDPRAFLESVYALHRWRRSGLDHKPQALPQFHNQHHLMLLARSPKQCRELEQSLDQIINHDKSTQDYLILFMRCMNKKPDREGHYHTLMHALEYLDNHSEKQRLLEAMAKYKDGTETIDSVLELFRQRLKQSPQAFLQQQLYFRALPQQV